MGQDFLHHYEACKHELFTYLMYRLNFNKPLAEDLLMDVVLKAYTHFAQFDPQKGPFKNWIFTLARNHLINFWWDHKEAASLEGLEEAGMQIGADPDTASPIDRDLDRQRVHRIILLLQNADRELIALRYLHDLSLDEISRILQKKPGAVRTALSRALQQFKAFYQKFYPNPYAT